MGPLLAVRGKEVFLIDGLPPYLTEKTLDDLLRMKIKHQD